MSRTKGFTLIELLVVISIISLLSSIALSSLNSAREKARISAGTTFSTHTYRAFGADAALVWDFDESSGDVIDLSGNNNYGAFMSGAARAPGETPSGKGSSVSLNGSTQYVVAVDSSSLNVSGPITLSAWIKPTTVGGDYKAIMAKRSASTNYEIYLGNGDGVLSYYNGTQYRSTFVPKTNVWTHVAATLSGNRLTLYANGTSVYSVSGVTMPTATPGNFSVGVPGSVIGEFFHGFIDDVRVYTQAIASADINAIYAQGIRNILLAGNPRSVLHR